MKAGYVPTERVGPIISMLVRDRWPDGNGPTVLAEMAGCDEAFVRAVCTQLRESAEFDLVDRLLCALGRPDIWWGELGDVYYELRFLHTCELPSCNKKFLERGAGHTRKRYCSSKCATLMHAVRDERATGERRRQRGLCIRGHKLTAENTIVKERERDGRPYTERQCRECKRETQRNWMRKKRENPEFAEKKREANRRWRARQAA
jgi:hypothetical protein